jgi:hypothetical protein
MDGIDVCINLARAPARVSTSASHLCRLVGISVDMRLCFQRDPGLRSGVSFDSNTGLGWSAWRFEWLVNLSPTPRGNRVERV